MTLGNASIQTLKDLKLISTTKEIYEHIKKANYYSWGKGKDKTAEITIGRDLNQLLDKPEYEIGKVKVGTNVYYYHKEHITNEQVEQFKKDLGLVIRNIKLDLMNSNCVQLLMQVFEANIDSNRKGFKDPKFFYFFSSEVKTVNHIVSILDSINNGTPIATQYNNHLTNLDLVNVTTKELTKEGIYLVENYVGKDLLKDRKLKLEVDKYIFTTIIKKIKNDSFINEKAKIFSIRIANTVSAYYSIPKEERETILENDDEKNLLEVLFLQRINFTGNEIVRYFKIENSEREKLKKCIEEISSILPQKKPKNLNIFEDTIFEYIDFQNRGTMQKDARIRAWNNLKIYHELIKESKDNILNFDYEGNIINKQEKKLTSNLKKFNDNKIEYKFDFKNILFKGVPGTGKSYTIDTIINNDKQINLSKHPENILRINIHSASSNADLMQGIGISTTSNDQLLYIEKQGLIFDHIRNACFSPLEPFVLILEEIQENSLNELIGDLIYLIEDKKSTDIANIYSSNINEFKDKKFTYLDSKETCLVQKYLSFLNDPNSYKVKIPNLVESGTSYREMILPKNLYVFCTSNYREDKKVIEDNLLRRFHVIELYPQNKKKIDYESNEISDFLNILNDNIEKHLSTREIHPDRFLIGHANWNKIKEGEIDNFYVAFLKVFIEFKEIKELDFQNDVKEIFKKVHTQKSDNNWVFDEFNAMYKEYILESNGYRPIIQFIQNRIYKSFLEHK